MRPCVRSCPKNPAWSHLVQCFHHGKFLNCRKLSTKTLLQSTRIEVRFGLMGFWLPPFESFEFHRIRSIPQTLSIPTSQAMEWWDPSPCSWRANSAAAKIKGSLANFVSAGSYRKEFRGWPLAPLELTFAHLQTDLMYIWCNCFYEYDVIGILGVYGVLE